MTVYLFPILLLAASVLGCWAQNQPRFESRHFSFECSEVAKAALAYLPKHGLSTATLERDSGLRIFRDNRKPWTDAAGTDINDFRVYWTYTDRKSSDRLPLGMWRLRLSHYEPQGKMFFSIGEAGCVVKFSLFFLTDGAIVRGILPAEDAWETWSNGRMERDYLVR